MLDERKEEDVVNIPNALSALRISMAPALLYLAFTQHPTAFLAMAILTELIDAVDGIVARRLNQVTSVGSQLDTSGDFILYATLAFSAFVLWPDLVLQELPWFILVIACLTLPGLLSYVKYRRFMAFGTWSVKAAAIVGVVGYLLLFGGVTPMVFRIGAIVSVIAAIEEIAISMIGRQEHMDLRSFWHARNSLAKPPSPQAEDDEEILG